MSCASVGLCFGAGLGLADPKVDRAKSIAIAEEAANSLLVGQYQSECRVTLPEGYKFVDPKKAVVTDEDQRNWRIAWTGVTPDGYGYEVTLSVAKDNSGSYINTHKVVTCKGK